MRTLMIRTTAIAAAAFVALSFATPATADEYPSWDDVQAAKSNEATAQAEADRIVGLLDQLQAESDRLGDEAVAKGAAAGRAKADYDAQSERAAQLNSQADAATTAAATAKREAGTVVAQMARMGAADSPIAIMLDTKGSGDDLLSKLSAIGKLSSSTAQTYEKATAASNTAASLSTQATKAETERKRLSDAADAAYDDAMDSSKAADAAVAEQQANRDRLYEQLAVLKNTTAETEKQYAQGEAERKAEEERAAAAAAAAGDDGGADSPPPPGLEADPDGAKAYAASAIGSYGWGDGEYQCLLRLWTRESDWEVNAYNDDSGAYGIPQSLPGSKMSTAGDDWRTNAATQINWGLNYIDDRYGTPCEALNFHYANNWY